MSSAEDRSILRSSAVMASGTIVSRLTGVLRATLLTWALGTGLHADVFNIANTIPNMLYILLAGGIFNAVLVPQLVRAMKYDEDQGEAYTNRIVTLAALFLAAASVFLVLAAPWVMDLLLDPRYADLPAQRESVITFARYCLPQVFFYGMFVLVGQILNARGRFGPMMWAPIVNNLISIAVLVGYLLINGQATDLCGGFTTGQEQLLGIGATVGIAAQLLVLLPYLRAAGFTFHPRFDFRHSGLGHTLRLGLWTVLFVVVNQIAYSVVVRLASSGTAQAALTCAPDQQGTGYTVYSQSFLIMMAPHSVVTVSLATAILPRLSAQAAEADLAAMAKTLTNALRMVLSVIAPFAALVPIIAPDLANLMFGHGAARDSYQLYVPTLSLFGIGLLLFTVHYLMLRGFYALERTPTVFWIQCCVAATNIAAAVLLVRRASAEETSPALVIAYTASYAVGAMISFVLLSRRLGGFAPRSLTRFLVRLLVAVALAAASAYLLSRLLHGAAGDSPHWTTATGVLVLVTGVAVVVYLGVARLLHLSEVGAVLDTVAGRLLPRRRA